MNTPHLGLLRAYENEEVFYKKASGAPRLSDEVGRLFAGHAMDKIAKGPASVMTSAPALGGLLKSAPKPSALPHIPSPLHGNLPASPVSGGKAGPDLGAFAPKPPPVPASKPAAAPPAAASAPAKAAPAAKPAAPAAPAGKGLPWNRILLTGGMLGAGALGLGAMKAGLNFLGGGHGGHAGYGSAPGGYMPPMGVNAYGQPQMGTPIM